MTSYGVIFPTLPLFQSSNEDTSNFWNIEKINSRVRDLWKLICDTDICTS